ncbi:zinc finger, CCHC-type containing protein, partial [Tanacetum coccineum]
MTTNFRKLDKFEGHDFRRWQKKMHFLLTTLKVVYVLTTPMPKLMEDDTNVDSTKELWDSLESKYMTEDASSKKFLVSNFNNYKMVDSRPVMEQFNELLRILGQYTQHGLKMDESIYVSSVIDKLPPSWKDFKHTLKHGKDDLSFVQLGSHLRIEESLREKDSDKGKVVLVPTRNLSWNVRSVARLVTSRGIAIVVDAIAWWIDSGATTHVCKDRCWFKTYETVEYGSVLYMSDDHFAHNLIYGPVLNKCGYKQVYESDKYILSKSGVFVGFGYYNNGIFMLNLNKVPNDSGSIYMSSSTIVNSSLWHARLEHVHHKRMLEISKDDLIPAIDENSKKCNKKYGIIHGTTAPYTPQKNGVAKRKNRALKEMVNSIIPYSGAVVRLLDPKRKTLGEKGINCIFVGYAEHYKAYRFYVIDEFFSINSIIKSRDAIFDENRFFSIPRPKDIIPNSVESQRDDHSDDVPNEAPKPRKGKRVRKAKPYGSDFQLYLVERSRDQVGSQYSYCYSIEEDPRTYNEAMQSRDAAFWKEAINDEIGSIMENNTWVLSDLPPGCKPLGCKWIFKRKVKVARTIDKFKARLVIQGCRQKEGIDYFDTYAPIARITTIRLLLALATIHNLVIHQMDVKT